MATNSYGRHIRESGHAAEVLPIELFFDLVYVLAVTQITRYLLEHLTWQGAEQALVLLLAVWLGWINVTWVTNYFELRHRPIRIMLLVLMVPSLVASASIPSAFDGRDLPFALGFAGTMVISTVWVWVAIGPDHPLRRVFLRVAIWWISLVPIGLAGTLLSGDAQASYWLVSVLLALFVIWAGFPVPGLGHSHSTDYPISGAHMAHRCLLFVTIALGESVLITGSDFGDLPSSFSRVVAFATAFVSIVAIWWIYFDRHAEAAAEMAATAEDPGRLGLIAYSYIHPLIIAGIIVAAAGNEVVLAHPRDEVSSAQALLILGGPALFLLGTSFFKFTIWHHISVSRAGGLLAIAALCVPAMMVSSLALLACVTAVLCGVAAYDLIVEARTGRVPIVGTEVGSAGEAAVAES